MSHLKSMLNIAPGILDCSHLLKNYNVPKTVTNIVKVLFFFLISIILAISNERVHKRHLNYLVEWRKTWQQFNDTIDLLLTRE